MGSHRRDFLIVTVRYTFSRDHDMLILWAQLLTNEAGFQPDPDADTKVAITGEEHSVTRSDQRQRLDMN